jgi:hypothetical protein
MYSTRGHTLLEQGMVKLIQYLDVSSDRFEHGLAKDKQGV